MLFFFSVRVNPKEMSLDDLWNFWDRQAESAAAAKEAGKIVSLYIMSNVYLIFKTNF